VRQLQNCGLTIGDIKEILFLRDADRPVASKRLTEILRARLGFLEERIASMESCRSRLTDVMRDVAAARSGGYDVLDGLPDAALATPFRFGRRGKEL
jgi:DNA-binding transcriptional MerR regulator